MTDEKQLADELQLLRALSDEAKPRERRLELLKSLQCHAFLDPEHRVVFESICYLFLRGGVSAERLTVHLNNRGFPDIDVRKYLSERSAS
jgi:hypothetical protein